MCCSPYGVTSPRASAIVQQFLRSRFDNNPSIKLAAWRADSYRVNRGRSDPSARRTHQAAAAAGHSLVDTRRYLPKSWIQDPQRCRAAGLPEDIEFATKPKLAQAMITDALDAGVPASWVTGDEVYGADSALRATCREHGIGYALAVACNHHVDTAPVPLRTLVHVAGRRWTIEESFQTAKGQAGLDEHQSAPGPPGTDGPSCRCSPWPSWPSPAEANVPEHPTPEGPDPLDIQHNSTTLRQARTQQKLPHANPSGPGQSGGENTKPPPAHATIAAGQHINDLDLKL
jgi:hypothetical protein